MRNIAVFGSAFNPPSIGHKSVIESLTQFDRILLVPSRAHAWGKTMLDFQLRCQLVSAFIADLGLDNVELCRVEEQLDPIDNRITTYQLLTHLADAYPDDRLTFIIGPDNLMNFYKFHHAQKIMDRFSVMAMPEKVKVRSSDIRLGLQQGQDISHLTTASVFQLLDAMKWY